MFRPEVAAARETSQFGEVRVTTPLGAKLLTIVAAVIGTVIALWLFLGAYTRRERVEGFLAPQNGLARLEAKTTGELAKLFVKEGDSVRQGDPIALISSERFSAQAESSDRKLRSELSREKASVTERIRSIQQQSVEQADGYQKQIALTLDQLRHGQSELALYQSELTRQAALLKKMRDLARNGFVSKAQLDQQETSHSLAALNIARQQSSITGLQQQLKSNQAALVQLPTRTELSVAEAEQNLAQIEGSLIRNDRDRESLIVASADGVIASITAQLGQTLSAGQSVVTLVPKGEMLMAHLFVRSSAMGFLETDTEIALLYESYPFQKFGAFRGKVYSISKSPISSSEISELGGTPTSDEKLYKITVAIPSQQVRVAEQAKPLKPGMIVHADLMLESRRIYQWLFEPLRSLDYRVSDAS